MRCRHVVQGQGERAENDGFLRLCETPDGSPVALRAPEYDRCDGLRPQRREDVFGVLRNARLRDADGQPDGQAGDGCFQRRLRDLVLGDDSRRSVSRSVAAGPGEGSRRVADDRLQPLRYAHPEGGRRRIYDQHGRCHGAVRREGRCALLYDRCGREIGARRCGHRIAGFDEQDIQGPVGKLLRRFRGCDRADRAACRR